MEIKYISDLDEDFEKTKNNKKKPAEQKKSEKSAESKKLGNIFQTFMRMSTFGKSFVLSVLGIIIFCALLFAFLAYSSSFTKIENVRPLSTDQETEFSALLNSLYPEKRTSILKELPYSVSKANLDVWAGSAILIDASNGCVLFEKNADAIIPPASIAKLFVMYIVFKDAAEGKISLDDVVPLPERSWAVNMPSDASLMFLGQGQIVTLRELLKGLAVASGNDAALAVADYISGSTKAFVARMNEAVMMRTILLQLANSQHSAVNTSSDFRNQSKNFIPHQA